jgi:hypothetical protein
MKKSLGVVLMIGLLFLSACDFAHNTNTNSRPAQQIIPQVVVQATLVPLTEGEYQLKLVATVPTEYHIYSINQKGDGPRPTNIELGPGAMVDREAKWTENPKPIILHYDFLPGIDVETLSGQVEWTLNVSSFDPNEPLVITGLVTVYPCSDRGCLMAQTIKFTTK